jgi:hypothetical protein
MTAGSTPQRQTDEDRQLTQQLQEGRVAAGRALRPPRRVTRGPGPADLRGGPGPLHRRPSTHLRTDPRRTRGPRPTGRLDGFGTKAATHRVSGDHVEDDGDESVPFLSALRRGV